MSRSWRRCCLTGAPTCIQGRHSLRLVTGYPPSTEVVEVGQGVRRKPLQWPTDIRCSSDRGEPGGAGGAAPGSGQQQQPSGRSFCCSAVRKHVAETDLVHGLPRPHRVLLDATLPARHMLGPVISSRACPRATAACTQHLARRLLTDRASSALKQLDAQGSGTCKHADDEWYAQHLQLGQDLHSAQNCGSQAAYSQGNTATRLIKEKRKTEKGKKPISQIRLRKTLKDSQRGF